MDHFTLDPRLAADTVWVADWALSTVRLMDDSRFPWVVLIPRRAHVHELHELSHGEALVLLQEMQRASRGLQQLFGPDKINIGALGNIVPQLHVHVVARRQDDAAWPGPVWGRAGGIPYSPEGRQAIISSLVTGL
ncbi:MAG: HIT family protein [Alphaproteobacteria bacterium]|nr:HIT family protein [Alphaproteobacteria bacterium]